MVRCVISILTAIALIIGAAVWERSYLINSFDDFHTMLDAVYEKLENGTANEEDVKAAQELWLKTKRTLHVFVPHTEIKEIDLWISECITYARYGKTEDAQAKIEVVRELTEQIPKTFLIKFENIF